MLQCCTSGWPDTARDDPQQPPYLDPEEDCVCWLAEHIPSSMVGQANEARFSRSSTFPVAQRPPRSVLTHRRYVEVVKAERSPPVPAKAFDCGYSCCSDKTDWYSMIPQAAPSTTINPDHPLPAFPLSRTRSCRGLNPNPVSISCLATV